jgi:hypothetical protein
MITEPYTVKRLGKMQASIACNVKAMGFDPNPGIQKHCYCDGDLVYDETHIEDDLAEF